MLYGLLGKGLGHSYSKLIHREFGEYNYELFEKSESEVEKFILGENIKGLNVTMPYKKMVVKYCDYVSEKAERIGGVNTLVYDENRKLHGYNTDYNGFLYLIEHNNIKVIGKKIAILGTGATSETIRTVLEDLGAKNIVKVSRTRNITYKDEESYIDSEILINSTPVGMYPNCPDEIINLDKFKNLEVVVDVIYNPTRTKLLIDAANKGIKAVNGLEMLIGQAKFASEIFTNSKIEDKLIDEVVRKFRMSLENIVIIGMPGSGKTSVGKSVARNMNREFIDIDLEIEKTVKMKPSEIINQYGEPHFRQLETEELRRHCMKNEVVISTGGGSILKRENYYYMKENGMLFLLERELSKLDRKDRPLSKSIEKLYEQRKEKYIDFSDIIVQNENIEETAKEIEGKFYENFSN
ncbi:shikimate dehydrogenase [Anaerosphaera aminiphila DSM 21120]|uniref:Shikimate kinase n=1 Tax=Anaerosphaera aminiphila DSM 21120 TaxID=1120995 RepID=A0A1M5PTR1_9FIRM|nr:shikimate kinase [Anaerosphaera aminiphila]SHH04663.1 shikimate dehydrogenase [Anaerosphaera aminiphila DSM 21120]